MRGGYVGAWLPGLAYYGQTAPPSPTAACCCAGILEDRDRATSMALAANLGELIP